MVEPITLIIGATLLAIGIPILTDVLVGSGGVVTNEIISLGVKSAVNTFNLGFNLLFGEIWAFLVHNVLSVVLVIFWIVFTFYIQYHLIKGYIWLFKNLFSMLKILIGKLLVIPFVKEEINKLMSILDFTQTKKNEND